MLEIMRQRHAELMAIEEAKLGRGKREAARKISYKPVLPQCSDLSPFFAVAYLAGSVAQRAAFEYMHEVLFHVLCVPLGPSFPPGGKRQLFEAPKGRLL